MEVQIISAPWCKRCHVVKPEVARYCALTGSTMTAVEYDDLDEKEQATVKSLPTIRMKAKAAGSGEWSIYTADTLEVWKTDIVKLAPADTDF